MDLQLVQISENVKENVHLLAGALNDSLVQSMEEVVEKVEDVKRQPKLYPQGVRKEKENVTLVTSEIENFEGAK